jgi:hypothetical protein
MPLSMAAENLSISAEIQEVIAGSLTDNLIAEIL